MNYQFESQNREAVQYVHAFEILPGGRYISGSTYQNIAMANQSTRFVGVRWSSRLLVPYVAKIGRSKRKMNTHQLNQDG